jgi:hypothetical protein
VRIPQPGKKSRSSRPATTRCARSYDANYLIDNRLGIIVDAEGTRANRSAEIAVTETMIARVARRYAPEPKAARGRHGLRDRAPPEVAHRSRYRAAHPRMGQVSADERPLHARRLLV